jgi:nitrite reductase/ring-hydroxylating ferredoxin subunit
LICGGVRRRCFGGTQLDSGSTSSACIEDVQGRDGFPPLPASWYYLCPSRELNPGPVGTSLTGRTFVGYRCSSGNVVVLDGRCIHLGADLARGCVAGDAIRCPFHEWEFGADGRCVRIPSTSKIPAFARQRAFPVTEVGGHVFFFNRPTALFPLPFFEGIEPAELRPAKPFELIAETPWYLVGANAFDLQHFGSAHDRTLVGEHVVDSPSPFARRISANFDVTGTSVHDRLTRRVSGPQVRLTVTDWSGNLILVTAKFRRTTSYGLVATKPLGPTRTLLRVIVWVKRSRSALGRAMFDPLDARVRRSFIYVFVKSDADRSAGARYSPGTLIDADRELAGYFAWLKALSNGSPPETAHSPAPDEGTDR